MITELAENEGTQTLVTKLDKSEPPLYISIYETVSLHTVLKYTFVLEKIFKKLHTNEILFPVEYNGAKFY